MLFSRVTDLECAIFRYPGWKKVINKMPSLVDIRESLSSLANACHDVGSDKVCIYKNCITRPLAPQPDPYMTFFNLTSRTLAKASRAIRGGFCAIPFQLSII